MQNERNLRLTLQENMETMASQMHGLESDAHRSVVRSQSQRTGSQGSREVVFPHPATVNVDTSKGTYNGQLIILYYCIICTVFILTYLHLHFKAGLQYRRMSLRCVHHYTQLEFAPHTFVNQVRGRLVLHYVDNGTWD